MARGYRWSKTGAHRPELGDLCYFLHSGDVVIGTISCSFGRGLPGDGRWGFSMAHGLGNKHGPAADDLDAGRKLAEAWEAWATLAGLELPTCVRGSVPASPVDLADLELAQRRSTLLPRRR